MAFDFPSSPTTGTIYAPSGGPTYRYDGLVWSMISTPFQGAFPSDTAPSNPVHGQLWWETDTGLLYVYYTDANSSQWVEVVSSGLPGAVRFDVAQTLSAAQKSQAQVNIGQPISLIQGGDIAGTSTVFMSLVAPLAAGFKSFQLRIAGLPPSAGVVLAAQVSTDNGTSWLGSPQYGGQIMYSLNGTPSTPRSTSSPTSNLQLSHDLAAGYQFACVCDFFVFTNAATFVINTQCVQSAPVHSDFHSAQHAGGAGINAIYFSLGGGNFAADSHYGLYGFREA